MHLLFKNSTVNILDLSLYLGLVFILFKLLLANDGLPLYFQLKTLRDTQKTALIQLEDNKQHLTTNYQQLKNNPVFLDSQARSVWHMKNPEEVILWN